jgi:ubiquitin carboxyl-terminal hydrolase 2/21
MDFISSEQGQQGLPNVGNSCYLNATIQCLAGTGELLKYFCQIAKLENQTAIKRYKIDLAQEKTIKNNKTQTKIALTESWFNLLMQLWSTKEQVKKVNPVPFYRLIGQVAKESKTSISISGDQNDFQEFLILLLDSLHDALSRETKMNIIGQELNQMDKMSSQAYLTYIKHFEKDYSIFVKLFTGQIKTITMGECGHQSMIFDPIKFFPLIVNKSSETVSLEDLFQEYIKEIYLVKEKEDRDERWFCNQCNTKVNGVIKHSIWDLPQYLIISLGRYQYFPRQLKVNTNVVYPLENLDMNPFHSGFKNKSMKYNLYAVSNHFGNQNGGHYTAFRKNPNGKWYHFNDNSVTEVKPESVITNNAYCLFYERI